MTRFLGKLACGSAWIGLCAAVALAGGGSSVDTPSPTEPEKSPEQIAAERYNEGLAYRDQAWKLQEKLDSGTLPEAKAAKTEKKIRNAWDRAIKEFTAAIGNNPAFHQAHGSLGYVYRQIGDYERALEAYDEALRLAPDYAEAIEYRGEAYLGLNRINDAQNAYRMLADQRSKYAGDLLAAMQTWIEQRKADPAGVDSAALDGFARWVEDRADEIGGNSLRKARTW